MLLKERVNSLLKNWKILILMSGYRWFYLQNIFLLLRITEETINFSKG